MQPKALLGSMSLPAAWQVWARNTAQPGRLLTCWHRRCREIDGGASAVGVGAGGDGCKVGQLIKAWLSSGPWHGCHHLIYWQVACSRLAKSAGAGREGVHLCERDATAGKVIGGTN